MDIYNLGKIHIMPNGEIFAHINQPISGHVYMHNIYKIVQKEISRKWSILVSGTQ